MSADKLFRPIMHPFDDDKLKEECGLFGVVGHNDAARLVALGLHALQHRGQEAGGMVTYDDLTGFNSHRRFGYIRDSMLCLGSGHAVTWNYHDFLGLA